MAIEDYYHAIKGAHIVHGVDEYGDTVERESEPYEFAGYIGKPSSKTALVMAQRNITIDGRLYAPIDAPVRAFDVITDDNGQRYTVASEPRDAARRGHHIEADLTLLVGGA